MENKIWFKLQKYSNGLVIELDPKWKIELKTNDGYLFVDYNPRYPVGSFKNLKQEGDNLFVEINCLLPV